MVCPCFLNPKRGTNKTRIHERASQNSGPPCFVSQLPPKSGPPLWKAYGFARRRPNLGRTPPKTFAGGVFVFRNPQNMASVFQKGPPIFPKQKLEDPLRRRSKVLHPACNSWRKASGPEPSFWCRPPLIKAAVEKYLFCHRKGISKVQRGAPSSATSHT